MKKTITYLTLFILLFNVIFTLNTVQAHEVELDPEGYISMPMFIYGGSGKISISSSLTSTYELYYQPVEITDELYNQISKKYTEKENYYNEEKTKLDEEKANLEVLETEYKNIVNDSTATEEAIEEARTKYNEAVNNYNEHVNLIKAKVAEYNQAIKALKPMYIDANWIKTTDGNFEIDTSKYTGQIHFILWAKLVVGTESYYDETIYSTQGTKQITISLDKNSAEMKVGDTLKLTATTNSEDTITWSSNKTDIATVSEDGTVTAIAKGVATITATVGEKSANCTITVEEETSEDTEGDTEVDTETEVEGDWTDFSNAKFELKKEGAVGISDAIIEISNITPKTGHFYYLSINTNNSKPDITSLTNEERNNLIRLSYNEETKSLQTVQNDTVAAYVELNKDIYISIIEEESYNNENVVLYGEKLERFAEPKYSDAFFATFISNTKAQIVTKFTHGEINERKMQIKIGKITDTAILEKIKNQDASGFANLLSFAKSNGGIYDKIVNSSEQSGFAIEYMAGEGMTDEPNELIDLKNLEEDAYYFLYVKADDENGKYICQEAVTLAKPTIGMDGYWSLHFYGSDDFEWADFGDVEPPKEDDTSKDPFPNAGLNTIVWIIAGVALAGVFSYKQFQKNNF